MYPLDEFFDLADELGILIWQDFMYACALYESDPKHLEMAKQEVNYQVRRLQHHPSIAIFAGKAFPWERRNELSVTTLRSPNASQSLTLLHLNSEQRN